MMITRMVNKSLTDRLEELVRDPNKVVQLDDAMLLARASCDEVIASYEQARIACGEAEDAYIRAVETGSEHVAEARKTMELARGFVLSAGSNLRDALNSVKGINVDAAKIRAMTQGTLTQAVLDQVLTQCVSLVQELCGVDHEDIADRFEEIVGNRVRIESANIPMQANVARTTIDVDARRMLNSVPAWDGDDDDVIA